MLGVQWLTRSVYNLYSWDVSIQKLMFDHLSIQLFQRWCDIDVLGDRVTRCAIPIYNYSYLAHCWCWRFPLHERVRLRPIRYCIFHHDGCLCWHFITSQLDFVIFPLLRSGLLDHYGWCSCFVSYEYVPQYRNLASLFRFQIQHGRQRRTIRQVQNEIPKNQQMATLPLFLCLFPTVPTLLLTPPRKETIHGQVY